MVATLVANLYSTAVAVVDNLAILGNVKCIAIAVLRKNDNGNLSSADAIMAFRIKGVPFIIS